MRKDIFIAVSAAMTLSSLTHGATATRSVMAVLSSESTYYRQAWDGFQQFLGGRCGLITLQDEEPVIPPDVKVVVAFGAKAALQVYPKDISLIYCMAPGTIIPDNRRTRHSVKVEMLPRPGFVLSKMKEVQPGMKKMAVLWSSEALEDYVREMQKAAASFGVEVEAVRPGSPDNLPDSLRGLKSKPDALWLPPDPNLITPTSFSILKEYAWSNRVPFYVPTDGLVEKGATASVACTLKEIGRVAALAARQFEGGNGVSGGRIYPEEILITISRASAKATGLELNERTISKEMVIIQ